MQKIYFDYAATTPTDPLVAKAMEPYFFLHFGNASSPHVFGREAKKALEQSRRIIADVIGAKLDEIIFTSGGSESNNYAIFGAAESLSKKGNHIITSSIEHHSVKEPLLRLQEKGFKVTWLPVDKYGRIDPVQVKNAITDKTILISIMHANNEIGTVEPISEIGKIARERGVYFHVDAVQTVGQIPLNVSTMNIDLLSLGAHKFYGPKGIGALYIRKGVKIASFLLGGDQEKGQRASTQNVAGAVGMAKALELCASSLENEMKRQIVLRDQIISGVLKIKASILNGHSTDRLPKNAHFSFEGVDGESLVLSLDMVGIAASMGSACTSGALEPSHVLRAIGLSDQLALGSLRVTIGRWTKQEDVDYFLKEFPDVVERLRKTAKVS